jgi:hypothetical protein
MSTDFSIRPVGAPAPSPVVQPLSKAASDGVSTVLPASQSVTAAAAGAGVSSDLQAASEDVSHQAFFDRAAASVVYQIVNEKNNQVVEQYPDEAVLRRRAYFHTLDLIKEQVSRPLVTDRVA